MADNPRIDDLRRRVEKDPASIAFAQLAEEYRRAGLFQESVDVCRTGLAVHPGYLSARVTLGRVLIETGQLDEAQGELELVLKKAPENLAAVRGLAEIHHKRGSLAEALTHYKTALSLARNDPELEETVADLTRQLMPAKRPQLQDGLSFEEMQHEMTVHVPPPAPLQAVVPPDARSTPPAPAPPAPALQAPAPPAPAPQAPVLQADLPPPSASDPHRERAMQKVAALEQWLDAIHAERADRRA